MAAATTTSTKSANESPAATRSARLPTTRARPSGSGRPRLFSARIGRFQSRPEGDEREDEDERGAVVEQPERNRQVLDPADSVRERKGHAV